MQQFEEQDYTKRFDLSLWKKILHYAKDYYRDLARLGICMGITAGCDVVFPLLTSYAIDHFIPNLNHPGGTEGLPAFIVAYLLLLCILKPVLPIAAIQKLFAAAQSGTDDKAFYERFRGIYRQASSAAAEDQCFAEPELCDAIMYAALRARAGQSAALAMLAALDPEGK